MRRAQDVDLHKDLLNISMPADVRTALLALNITKDMWVHPLAYVTEGTPSEMRNPSFWVLCPMVKSVGLPETAPTVLRPTLGLAWIATALWLHGPTLVPALKFATTDWHPESDGPRRIGYVEDIYARDYGLSSNQPFDGTLVVVLTVAHQYQKDTQPAVSPAFAFHVGIATRDCDSNSIRTCTPEHLVSAQPLTRGGVTQLAHYNEAYETTCDACGFLDPTNSAPYLGGTRRDVLQNTLRILEHEDAVHKTDPDHSEVLSLRTSSLRVRVLWRGDLWRCRADKENNQDNRASTSLPFSCARALSICPTRLALARNADGYQVAQADLPSARGLARSVSPFCKSM